MYHGKISSCVDCISIENIVYARVSIEYDCVSIECIIAFVKLLFFIIYTYLQVPILKYDDMKESGWKEAGILVVSC